MIHQNVKMILSQKYNLKRYKIKYIIKKLNVEQIIYNKVILKNLKLQMKQNSLSKNIKKDKIITPVVLIDEDQQKKKNFQLIGKMFGNLTQSINVNNNKTNLSSGSNKFTGGFKQSSILKNNKITLQQKDYNKEQRNKIDVFTVYDQFGLINDSIGKRSSNSKGKPKYREDVQQQGNDLISSNPFHLQQSSLNQMKNNRRQQFDQVMQNNYVNLHEYYDLAKQKDRQQTVIHVKSSLDNMTLQNVQAKLQAHRRQLKNVQKQYKAKKGIVQQNENDQQQIYQPNKKFTKTGQNDLYKQYGKTQSQIYQMIKKNQKDDHNQIVIGQMWQQKLKQNPKLLEYSKKYQQYLVQKDAKNILYGTVRQNLFKWDKYKQPVSANNKSTSKLAIKSKSKQRQLSISKLNKSLQKLQHTAQLQRSQLKQSNINQVFASKDDKFIAKYIFAQVDVDKKGLLSKEELLDYITKNEHIIKSYNIDLKWIYTDLDNYQTKRKGMLNKEELGIFLATFQRNLHPQIKLTDISQLSLSKQPSNSKLSTSNKKIKQSPFQISFNKDVYRFRNLFQKLDINQDKILKRQQFIQNIYIDPDCSKIIDNIVIRIKIIQKNITYRQIISFILDDYRKQKNQKLKKSKQYITFGRFCQYFQFPQSINLRSLGKKKNKQTLTNQIQIFDIENQNLLVLKDVFDTIPRVYQDFIVTADFIQAALVDPQVLSFQQDMCRIQSVETNLPIQTVRLTLQRMIKQSDQYIDWQSAKSFFSRRGRPLQWNEQLIKQKKAVRQQQRAKSINQALKRQLILKNELQISAKLKSQYQSQQKRTSQNNFTIPQPFKITDQIKSKDKKNNFQKEQGEFKDAAKQLNKTQQFKAKPVNKQILGNKPDLVQGKRPASSSKNIPEYKYENYQNDRIERALKKAQQKYQLQQKQRQIKQMANIKANKIGVDLTKNLFQVIKQEKKKSKPNDTKKPLTELQKSINERLHPTNNNDQQKIKKLQQKRKKQQETQKALNQKKKQQNMAKQDLIKKTRQQAQQVKKQKDMKDKKLKQAAANSQQTFKPKLNPKKQLSQAQKDAIQQARRARQQKQQQKQRKALQQKQLQRKKILQRQLKDPYQKIQGLSNQQIIDKIYSINLFDILIDNQQKQQFNSQHDFKNKDKKQRQIYLKGMANKFKIVMDKEDRVLKQLKIKQKQQIIKDNIAVKQKSIISQAGKSDKMKSDMVFHQSKALKRYRMLLQGKTPSQVPSQFDRYKEQDFDDNKKVKSKKIIPEVQDQQND